MCFFLINLKLFDLFVYCIALYTRENCVYLKKQYKASNSYRLAYMIDIVTNQRKLFFMQ